jgi:predicted DNA-binding antitoxin AbrB/MazE fold protein
MEKPKPWRKVDLSSLETRKYSLRLTEEIIQELRYINKMETKTLDEQIEAALDEWKRMMDGRRRESERTGLSAEEWRKKRDEEWRHDHQLGEEWRLGEEWNVDHKLADKAMKPTLVQRAPSIGEE